MNALGRWVLGMVAISYYFIKFCFMFRVKLTNNNFSWIIILENIVTTEAMTNFEAYMFENMAPRWILGVKWSWRENLKSDS